MKKLSNSPHLNLHMKVFKKHVPKYRILITKKPQPNNKMTIFKTILNLCHFRVTFPADRFTVYTLSAYMIAEFVSLELCYAGEKKKVIGVFWFFFKHKDWRNSKRLSSSLPCSEAKWYVTSLSPTDACLDFLNFCSDRGFTWHAPDGYLAPFITIFRIQTTFFTYNTSFSQLGYLSFLNKFCPSMLTIQSSNLPWACKINKVLALGTNPALILHV